MTAFRQVLVVDGAGGVLADVLVDTRALTYAQVDALPAGATTTLRELRGLAEDAVRWSPPGSTVHVCELVHHPERRTYNGRRTRRAVTYCRPILTIEVPSTNAAAAA